MNKKYPATWPDGSLKTVHTPFNWKFEIATAGDHLKTSQRVSEASECTTAFNQWRALMASAPKSALTWPEYLAQYNATAEAKASKAKRRAEMTEQVPQHLHLHSLGDKVTSVERTKAHRAKLIGKPNHARSQ